MSKVLILASGLSANEVNDYRYEENDWTIVAVNNGWLATDDWSYLVHSTDYKGTLPDSDDLRDDQVVTNKYRPTLHKFGGHEACGYSITLAGSYYALDLLKPTVIGYLGADMNYTPNDKGSTHIYGVGYDIKTHGKPDPDRMVAKWGKGDPNFLENIYNRFADEAKKLGCDVYNFSSIEDTRLPYPKASPRDFE